jgi:tetratricopeptide (TPR) repeat protein
MVNRFSELHDNMSEEEIRQGLSTFLSDELRAEFLENCLRKKLADSVKKNVHILLAQIYERKRWYGNAVKNVGAALSCTDVYREKIALSMKLGQLNILDDKHVFARDAFKMAVDFSNTEEKKKIGREIKDIYMNTARSFESKTKFAKAVSIYEYALDLLGDAEKRDVKQKLAVLYEKLGRITDSMRMKKEI